MLCDACKENQATVRLISVVDGQKTERHMCMPCVTKQKLRLRTEGVQSILSAFISSNAGKRVPKNPDLRCSGCGVRYDDAIQAAQMGCAHCYQEFSGQLKPVLFRMHGNVHHVGRMPQNVDFSMKKQRRLEQIRREMDIAVVLENFELAATLRDEIRELELKGQGGSLNA